MPVLGFAERIRKKHSSFTLTVTSTTSRTRPESLQKYKQPMKSYPTPRNAPGMTLIEMPFSAEMTTCLALRRQNSRATTLQRMRFSP